MRARLRRQEQEQGVAVERRLGGEADAEKRDDGGIADSAENRAGRGPRGAEKSSEIGKERARCAAKQAPICVLRRWRLRAVASWRELAQRDPLPLQPCGHFTELLAHETQDIARFRGERRAAPDDAGDDERCDHDANGSKPDGMAAADEAAEQARQGVEECAKNDAGEDQEQSVAGDPQNEKRGSGESGERNDITRVSPRQCFGQAKLRIRFAFCLRHTLLRLKQLQNLGFPSVVFATILDCYGLKELPHL